MNFDFNWDASLGFSFINIDRFRTVPGGTTRITSATSAERWFASTNLSAATKAGPWYLTGRAGLLWAKETTDAFTETDTTPVAEASSELGRFSFGVKAAYSWGNFEPFGSTTVQLDYEQEDLVVGAGTQPTNDETDLLVYLGLPWFGANGVSSSIQYNTVIGRDDFDSDTFSFPLRADC